VNIRRPEQIPPDGEWRTWYVRGGRGGGKTRTGSETLADWIRTYPGRAWGVVAPTYGDVRDKCIEGPSGLLRALHLPRRYEGWNRSMGQMFLPDGTVVYADGADDGALRIQGENLSGLWADEVGLWKDWKTSWDESIAFAVRMDPARIVATGTPKRGHPLVKRLVDDPTVPKTLVRTLDNAQNLSKRALDELLRRYSGTELGRQELEGEVLSDVPGALVRPDMIVVRPPSMIHVNGVLEPHYVRGCIAIDPAVSYGPEADETGIIAAALGADGNGYVVDDQSGRFSPDAWAKRAIACAQENRFDLIVAEVNNGGDLVEAAVRAAGWKGRYRAVHATRGKRTRAEAVSGGYERNLQLGSPGFRIFHVRPFPELEDQWCSFTPESIESPDRLDAEVWAFFELLIGGAPTVTESFSVAA
jgi:phage terminase large subunit-like protein